MLSSSEVLAQSKGAMAQWGETWEKNSKENGRLFQEIGHSHKELLFKSAGKTCLCVGMGPSLEDNIETIAKYADNPDLEIFCVDKATGYLINHGIIPDYVNVADAGIDYDKWLKPWIDHTSKINLIANINANIEYVHSWRRNVQDSKPIHNNNIWFYVNKDNIKSEEIYMKNSGCKDVIPAGSNVGNSVVIFAASILGYHEIITVGMDFAWGYNDNYYAFCDAAEIGTNKRGWMRHINMIGKDGEMTNTSQNLMFSARWLSDYYNAELKRFNIKLTDCSGKGVLFGVPEANLERKLKQVKAVEVTPQQKQTIFQTMVKTENITKETGGDERLSAVIKDNNVLNVVVNYVQPEDDAWLQAL